MRHGKGHEHGDGVKEKGSRERPCRVELVCPLQEHDEKQVPHEFVGGCASGRPAGTVDPGGDSKENRRRGKRTEHERERAVKGPDHHDDENVGDCVAYVVEKSPEAAPDPQFGSKDAIEVIHDVVVEDESGEIRMSLRQQQEAERKHSKDRYEIGEVSVDCDAERLQEFAPMLIGLPLSLATGETAESAVAIITKSQEAAPKSSSGTN